MSSKRQSIASYFLVKSTPCNGNTEADPPCLNSGEVNKDIEPAILDTNKKADDTTQATKLIVTPNQPRNVQFPKKDFGKQKRSFQPTWFKDYPWLNYNEESDSAFCYVCINQNETEVT